MKLSIGCLRFINHWHMQHNQNNVWLTNFKVLFLQIVHTLFFMKHQVKAKDSLFVLFGGLEKGRLVR
jgi:hypothetical protein